jgi:hypothetical protein
VGTTRNSILAGNMELNFREVVLGHFDEVMIRTQTILIVSGITVAVSLTCVLCTGMESGSEAIQLSIPHGRS